MSICWIAASSLKADEDPDELSADLTTAGLYVPGVGMVLVGSDADHKEMLDAVETASFGDSDLDFVDTDPSWFDLIEVDNGLDPEYADSLLNPYVVSFEADDWGPSRARRSTRSRQQERAIAAQAL